MTVAEAELWCLQNKQRLITDAHRKHEAETKTFINRQRVDVQFELVLR